MVYNYLDKINYPKDLKKFKIDDLKKIAEELRKKTIEAVSKTGGHLRSVGAYPVRHLPPQTETTQMVL